MYGRTTSTGAAAAWTIACLAIGCGGNATTVGGTDESTDSGTSSGGQGVDATIDHGGVTNPPADAPPGEDAASGGVADAAPDAGGPEAAPDASPEASTPSIALAFDGSSAYVALPTASGGASETAFTSEVWFKTTAATGMLFEVYAASGPNGADRSTYVRSGKVCFYVYGSSSSESEICSAGTFNDGFWHDAQATLGDNGQVLYVDGTVQATAPTITSSSFNWDNAFRLGYGYIGPAGALTYFQGDIDDVRLWSVELTAAQLVNMHGHDIDPLTPGLQGYWKLNGAGATATAVDSTPAAEDGTLVGFSFSPSPWVSPGAF
jgi:hypothetical protein